MNWVLVLVALTFHGHPQVQEIGRYDSMVECFDAREKLVDKVGKPIVNYQAICIQHIPK